VIAWVIFSDCFSWTFASAIEESTVKAIYFLAFPAIPPANCLLYVHKQLMCLCLCTGLNLFWTFMSRMCGHISTKLVTVTYCQVLLTPMTKIIGSKVKVRQQRPQNSCELNSSWTAEGIWVTTYKKYYIWEMNWQGFQGQRLKIKVVTRPINL